MASVSKNYDTNTSDAGATPVALSGAGKGKILFANARLRVHDVHVPPAGAASKKASLFTAPETVCWRVLPDESTPTPLPTAHAPGSSATLAPGRWFIFEILEPKPKYSEAEVKALLARPACELSWNFFETFCFRGCQRQATSHPPLLTYTLSATDSTDVGSDLFMETPRARLWDFTSSKGMSKDECESSLCSGSAPAALSLSLSLPLSISLSLSPSLPLSVFSFSQLTH